ncbi:Putative glutamine amidotransferase [Acidipropionibacterium acidipropionici ATCC 4875]|uniref:Glutamine amidotransferase n=2 Tax=Acidipropionibacterium acidipropionici TaxID=1748 RepID=K7S687_ACIA4|nr:glutamine amidotransferase [Acidipropionibacterium acidipropionici]AFV90152.1 Putative glutamine amidotransferase [Acidipropionibacterium acidipropionici ATCC 4875]
MLSGAVLSVQCCPVPPEDHPGRRSHTPDAACDTMALVKPFLLIATRPEDEAARGEYEAMLRFTGLAADRVLYSQLDRAPLPQVDLDDLSGIIVGGSPYSTSDPDDRKPADQRRAEAELDELLDRVVPADFPFFGACYGVGTLGVHQGAVVDRTYPEPVSAITVTLTDEGLRDPLIRASGVPESFQAFVGHKEAVRTLSDDAVLLATGEAAPVQMFRVGENMYATQFHPELDVAGIVQRIHIYRENGYFDPATMDELIETVSAARIGDVHTLLRAFVTRYAR